VVNIAFRLSTQSEKDKVNEILDEYSKIKNIKKPEALIQILDLYNKSEHGESITSEYIPPNVQEVLDEIQKELGCSFIKFMENDFYCLEQIARTKKPVMLQGSPEDVLDMCRACNKYREEKKQEKIDALRQKEYIKRLERFMKGLITISERGFITDVQFCIREVLDGRLGFSRDGQTLQCPLEDNELVYINEKCQTMLNPDTGLPPCQYFASIDKLVQMDKSVWEGNDLTLPILALDNDLPDPSINAPPKKRKIIEADQVEVKEPTEEEFDKEGEDEE